MKNFVVHINAIEDTKGKIKDFFDVVLKDVEIVNFEYDFIDMMEKIVENIFHLGYAKNIWIECFIASKKMVIDILDDGVCYNPLSQPFFDISAYEKSFKSLSSSCILFGTSYSNKKVFSYLYQDNKNMLKVRLKLQPDSNQISL